MKRPFRVEYRYLKETGVTPWGLYATYASRESAERAAQRRRLWGVHGRPWAVEARVVEREP